MNNREKIEKVIKENLFLDDFDEKHFLEIDSMDQLDLTFQLEREFDIEIPREKYKKIESLNDLENLINSILQVQKVS